MLAQLDVVDEGLANGTFPISRCFNRVLSDGPTISVCEDAINQDGRGVSYEDITERERVASRLSYIRGMTPHRSPNRVLFREHVEGRIKHMQVGGMLTVLCIDLDRFKP